MIEERAVASRPTSFLTVLSIFIFATMLVATGGLYFYKQVLAQNLTKMQSELTLAQNSFEPAKITQLQVLDKRLTAATQILQSHIAVSPIFEALSQITLKSIQYTKFAYTFDPTMPGATVDVKMSGVAVGYRSIALQADLFTQNKYLIDPVFSNLSLDDKGDVLFDLEFSVDPSFINYTQSQATGSSSAPSTQ